jgi:hypothetical protein
MSCEQPREYAYFIDLKRDDRPAPPIREHPLLRLQWEAPKRTVDYLLLERQSTLSCDSLNGRSYLETSEILRELTCPLRGFCKVSNSCRVEARLDSNGVARRGLIILM